MEDGGEGFLRDVDAADAFHAAFAGLLGFPRSLFSERLRNPRESRFKSI